MTEAEKRVKKYLDIMYDSMKIISRETHVASINCAIAEVEAIIEALHSSDYIVVEHYQEQLKELKAML